MLAYACYKKCMKRRCGYCRKIKPLAVGSFCSDDCKAKTKIAQQKWRSKQLEKGLCLCGRAKRVLANRCNDCLQKARESSKKNAYNKRAKNLCIWGGCHRKASTKAPTPGRRPHVLCWPHLLEMRTLNKALREERKKLGICIQCRGRLPIGRTAFCMACEPSKDGLTLEQHRTGNYPAHILALREARNKQVETILPLLSDKDKRIIMLRYGVGQSFDMPLREIANEFNLTRERIRQIIQTIRQRFGKDLPSLKLSN